MPAQKNKTKKKKRVSVWVEGLRLVGGKQGWGRGQGALWAGSRGVGAARGGCTHSMHDRRL